MNNYRIVFYRTARGDCPFKIFLECHNAKIQDKFYRVQKLLEFDGPNLKRPYADTLRDGIREIRIGFGGDSYRALFYFMIGRIIVITHGFIKKTDRVPDAEIERALRYRQDFEARIRSGEFEL